MIHYHGIYPHNQVITHKGMAGTIIIEDTSGFNEKTSLPLNAGILVLQYRDSDFKSLASECIVVSLSSDLMSIIRQILEEALMTLNSTVIS